MAELSGDQNKAGKSLQVFGGMLRAVSSFGQAFEAKNVAQQNALQLNAEADARLEDARTQAMAILRRSKSLKGHQRATSAARGVVVGTGSSLDILAETVINDGLRASDAIRVGQIQQRSLQHQASRQIRAGRSMSRAGFIQGTGTLLQTSLDTGVFDNMKSMRLKKNKRAGEADLPTITGLA